MTFPDHGASVFPFSTLLALNRAFRLFAIPDSAYFQGGAFATCRGWGGARGFSPRSEAWGASTPARAEALRSSRLIAPVRRVVRRSL
jgi:hypothetical protein